MSKHNQATKKELAAIRSELIDIRCSLNMINSFVEKMPGLGHGLGYIDDFVENSLNELPDLIGMVEAEIQENYAEEDVSMDDE